MKDETSNTSQLKIAEMGDQILQYQENESNIKIKDGMVNKNPIRQIKQIKLRNKQNNAKNWQFVFQIKVTHG